MPTCFGGGGAKGPRKCFGVPSYTSGNPKDYRDALRKALQDACEYRDANAAGSSEASGAPLPGIPPAVGTPTLAQESSGTPQPLCDK